MKSGLRPVFQHQHYSIEDLLACPDLPALLEWGEFRHLRQAKELDLPIKEIGKKGETVEVKNKKEKSTWSGLFTKLGVLFPYLWPKDKPGLQVSNHFHPQRTDTCNPRPGSLPVWCLCYLCEASMFWCLGSTRPSWMPWRQTLLSSPTKSSCSTPWSPCSRAAWAGRAAL